MSVTADVFLTVALRTSQGPGPGPKRLPGPEAAALVTARHAVYGTRPPKGYEDGGADPRDVVAGMVPRVVPAEDLPESGGLP